MRLSTKLVATLALLAPLGCGSGTQATPKQSPPAPPIQVVDPAPAPTTPPPQVETPPPAVEEPPPAPPTAPGQAKPLSKSVQKGLAWLASQEISGGGWGQGDEATKVRTNEPKVGTKNVADTSIALLAFLRAGHTPGGGEHKLVVDRGLGYVMSEIEASDSDSLFVTGVRGTRVQGKIGQYVDTFASLMVLTEAKGKMKSPADNARLDAAIKKVVRKIEKNQKDNGSWDEKGWAPVLSQALAAKGMNRAAQGGAQVSKEALRRIEEQAKNGQMSVSGSAGIRLYGDAASSANVRDDATTKRVNAEKLKEQVAKPPRRPEPMSQSPEKPPTAADVRAAEAAAQAANNEAVTREKALVAKLSDQRFVAGFGNNGGEEYLSYLLISETLSQSRGAEWEKWDGAITKLVEKVQNEDGSWVGHHCITGRTFNTAAALLVLMGDRTPLAHNVIAK
jgi:hypothetical protein